MLELFRKDRFRVFALSVLAVFLVSIVYPICREVSLRRVHTPTPVVFKQTPVLPKTETAPVVEVVEESLPKFSFTKNLAVGDNDPEVKLLQEYLNENGFVVAQSGPGSPGHETTLFGAGTKAALIKFQEAYADILLRPSGLSHGTGIFGKATRDFINS
jgi:peptidoglycan hydrolase-like protein with peptidoglycan-binding domain